MLGETKLENVFNSVFSSSLSSEHGPPREVKGVQLGGGDLRPGQTLE